MAAQRPIQINEKPEAPAQLTEPWAHVAWRRWGVRNPGLRRFRRWAASPSGMDGLVARAPRNDGETGSLILGVASRGGSQRCRLALVRSENPSIKFGPSSRGRRDRGIAPGRHQKKINMNISFTRSVTLGFATLVLSLAIFAASSPATAYPLWERHGLNQSLDSALLGLALSRVGARAIQQSARSPGLPWSPLRQAFHRAIVWVPSTSENSLQPLNLPVGPRDQRT